ncbi:probable LRR receptor-like serine/threonine-protein kinase At3g47570 [Daucus carota subsp. sativus]|uniref:probable LRR receptor-like serine/threonine-protein kinase At3g47570 n=1 Tax=Daucus carota subsp. sativus TaxID=79200 RepID=UPI0030832EDB
MEGNLFQGKIPSSFKSLRSLALLDLSNNNISGSVPSFFQRFRLIQFLNLSNNKLQGEVTKEGVFSNVSAFSVVGNLGLCGDNQYPRVSYHDLLLATNQFSPNNLLGKGRYGSVYKGVLQSTPQTVAVKVLNVEVRGANKSFIAECETLRNIRHRNLIKIITACSSTDFKGNDFKALVFEFMMNGSLDSWLHPSPFYQTNERNLTLLQRLNICIDVALGVDYLHHHSYTSIIHSDIKPSNILLDEEFVARVGDFGLARFSFATTSDPNQAQPSSTGVHGTVGYIPPEYGMGLEISAEGDVYSYGILLLEMFSGKRPTSSSILVANSNNLHEYVRNALPQRVMNIVDPRIIMDQEDHNLTSNQSYNKATLEVCLTSIFEVGILCSAEMPRERIDISVAIKQLHVARDKLLERRQ